MTGQINDDWKYTGMLENNEDLKTMLVKKTLNSNVLMSTVKSVA